MSTKRELLKAAGQVGADAIEACELLHQTLVAANDILKRYASREELIALDIEGALVAAKCIREGGRSRSVSSSDSGSKHGG